LACRAIATGLLAFNRDAVIRLAWSVREAVLTHLRVSLTRDLYFDANILPRLEYGNVAAILRHEIEGGDDFTFLNLALHFKGTEVFPAASLRLRLRIHLRFYSDEGIRNDTISFCPCLYNLISCSIA